TGPPIDLCRARSTLACLAIPAHGKIGRLVRLDVMKCIQHDHPRSNRDAVRGGLPTFAVSPEHLKDCFRHLPSSPLFLFPYLSFSISLRQPVASGRWAFLALGIAGGSSRFF